MITFIVLVAVAAAQIFGTAAHLAASEGSISFSEGCMIVVAFALSAVAEALFDMRISSHTEDNFLVAAEHGYSRSLCYKIWAFNIVGASASIVGLEALLYTGVGIDAFFVSWLLPFKLIIWIVVSDVIFRYAHQTLHRSFPEIHLLHHCCTKPSWTTNLFFHPIDFAVELGIPLLVGTVLYVFVTPDPLAHLCTMVIGMCWYQADHDQWLQLAHYQHHRYSNLMYWAYHHPTPIDRDPLDKVRPMVFRGGTPQAASQTPPPQRFSPLS